MVDYKDSITRYLSSSYYPYRTDVSDVFLKHFLDNFNGIKCVYMYGSMLNPRLSTSSSFPDFYVVVDDYKRFYKSSVHSMLNAFLPPNSYFLKLDRDGTPLPSKYCVLDTRSLDRTTRYPGIKDFYVAGRLAKCIRILYVDGPAFLSSFLDTVYNAMQFNVMFTLSEIKNPFTLDDFIMHLLALSYRSEVRTETEKKIESLYDGDRPFYTAVYGMFLDQELYRGSIRAEDGHYAVVAPYFTDAYTGRFISRGKRRAVYRLSKSAYTFSDYVSYLELKVERTTGEKLVLSPLDRKHPLIFGWRHVFKLLKKKAIR